MFVIDRNCNCFWFCVLCLGGGEYPYLMFISFFSGFRLAGACYVNFSFDTRHASYVCVAIIFGGRLRDDQPPLWYVMPPAPVPVGSFARHRYFRFPLWCVSVVRPPPDNNSDNTPWFSVRALPNRVNLTVNEVRKRHRV